MISMHIFAKKKKGCSFSVHFLAHSLILLKKRTAQQQKEQILRMCFILALILSLVRNSQIGWYTISGSGISGNEMNIY
jgi:hypothetical protein